MTITLSPWQQRLPNTAPEMPAAADPYKFRTTTMVLPERLEAWITEHGARWEPVVKALECEYHPIIYSQWWLPHRTRSTKVCFGRAMLWYSGYRFRYIGCSAAEASATFRTWHAENLACVAAQLRTMQPDTTQTAATTLIQGSFL